MENNCSNRPDTCSQLSGLAPCAEISVQPECEAKSGAEKITIINHNVYEKHLIKPGTLVSGANNRDAITVGLTVDNGRIVNRNIEYTMDGLVIVYATGGIVVSDIENKNLKIGGKTISVIEDKTELLDWAAKNQATIFQTQLLAYENTLRISRAGRKHERERRFLALAQSPGRGLYHIVFNLPQNKYLFDAARDVFYFLKETENMEVVALLNLDTGAYNVMELYKDNEQRDFSINGETDIKVSTNLIVYHYSR